MYSVQPLADFVLGGGRATVFAYGECLIACLPACLAGEEH